MADHHQPADNVPNAEVSYAYTGGRAPQHVINAYVDNSIKDIPDYAFNQCTRLSSIKFHDGVFQIGKWSFPGCCSLTCVKLSGVRILCSNAFYNCTGLMDVEFGNKLQVIGVGAFYKCTSLKRIKIQCVKLIESGAFNGCEQLSDLVLPKDLERIEQYGFANCHALRCIAMPLKAGMITNNVFNYCENLERIDLVGGVHTTISSLHLESWREIMKEEIDRINHILPHTPATGTILGGKNDAIKRWMEDTYTKMEQYKLKHFNLLKEVATLLELALWKVKLEEEEENSLHEAVVERLKIDGRSARNELRITSGANIVIKNVLPFLKLE